MYCFFFIDTAPTEIYTDSHTLSLHDALPICRTQEAPDAHVRQALNLTEHDSTIRLERLRFMNGRPLFHEQIWLPAARFGALLDTDLNDFGTLLYPFYEERCGMRVASARETLTVAAAEDRKSVG